MKRNGSTQRQQQQQQPRDLLKSPAPPPRNAKAINYVFVVTFALLAAFIIGAAFWAVSIATFNQLAMLGFTVATAAGMILCAVEGNRQFYEQRLFRIPQGFRIFVVLCAVLSLLTAWAPAYNLINILVTQCPLYNSTPAGRPACNATLTAFEAYQICLHEQGYAIALIIICFVIMLLDLAAAIVYGAVLK